MISSFDDRCSPELRVPLRRMGLEVFEDHKDVVFGVCADLRIGYLNSAWFDFARANGGERIAEDWALGRSLRDALPACLHPFYLQGLATARDSLQPWDHRYECSSSTEGRWFAMRVLPLPEGGWLFVNSLLLTQTLDDTEAVPIDRYQQTTGFIVQCSHCRRVRRRGPDQNWDFVPALIRQPSKQTSHGLCGICLAYHYPPPAEATVGTAPRSREVGP